MNQVLVTATDRMIVGLYSIFGSQLSGTLLFLKFRRILQQLVTVSCSLIDL